MGQMSTDLPLCTQLLEHQIAGHVHGTGVNKLGMLRHDDGCVLKPLFPGDVRAERELAFYQQINGNDIDDDIKELKQFVSNYYGTWTTTVDDRMVTYMRLGDLTASYGAHPCAADVKIGRVTYDPQASPHKQALKQAKYPHSLVTGFRVLGMRIYKPEKQAYEVCDREYGLKLTPDMVPEALSMFIRGNKSLARSFATRLEEIERWFERQRTFKIFASSLLFIYDGDDQTKCDVRMIDFAHVFPANGVRDDNYLFGLRSLIGLFKGIADDVRVTFQNGGTNQKAATAVIGASDADLIRTGDAGDFADNR